MKMLTKRDLFFIVVALSSVILSSCNYNYYQGTLLEKENRFEEANIEYHRAYTSSPDNDKYREAYERTAAKTAEDLLNRYQRYVAEKKFSMAYRRLEQARALAPSHPTVLSEQKKWVNVLLAGRVDLVGLKSLRDQLPLSDNVQIIVRINTPNTKNTLEARVDYQTKTFSVEDILYDPPQDLLMLYSINSIGVKLENYVSGRSEVKKFIDFKTPIPISVQGKLTSKSGELVPVDANYPADRLKSSQATTYWYPTRGLQYSLLLKNDTIEVESPTGHIEYLPQMLYMNSQDRRYFLDFGHYELTQPSRTSIDWAIRRVTRKQRVYLSDLKKNLLLHTYFSYRDGAYPFVVTE